MKLLTTLIFLFCYAGANGQITVDNQAPLVTVEYRRILYHGYDNPVYISAGNVKSLEVSVMNGTIKKTATRGKYIIVPGDSSSLETIVVLKGKNYRKEYKYQVRTMSIPDVRWLGQGYFTDQGVPLARWTTGIELYHKMVDVEIDYRIDSFKVKITDSSGTVFYYTNIGSLWTKEVKTKIQSLKKGSRILVFDIYATSSVFRRRFYSSYSEMYVSEPW